MLKDWHSRFRVALVQFLSPSPGKSLAFPKQLFCQETWANPRIQSKAVLKAK